MTYSLYPHFRFLADRPKKSGSSLSFVPGYAGQTHSSESDSCRIVGPFECKRGVTGGILQTELVRKLFTRRPGKFFEFSRFRMFLISFGHLF